MSLSDQHLTAFIVDFGLAKRYCHWTTGNHIPFHQVQRIRGTPAFGSIHSHLGAELGRHDDLKSLAYTLIYLVLGSLPWLGKDGCQQASLILEMKQKTAVEELCCHAPCELATFLTYTCMLSFLENPNYSYIQSLFSMLGHETSNPEHDHLLDLLPLEPVLPAPSPLESECRTPTPPPTSQCSCTSYRRKAAGPESTPCCKASRAAQQHQLGSTKITLKLSKHRYATTLFKLLKSDHPFVLSVQFMTPHPASCQNAHPTWLMVYDWTFSRHCIGRVGKYGQTLHYLLYVVHSKYFTMKTWLYLLSKVRLLRWCQLPH